MAIDATSVYVADFNADRIVKVRKEGGPLVVIAPRRFPSEQPYGVAVVGNRVYWTAYFRSYVGSVGVNGDDLVDLVSGQGYARDIVVDEVSVFWTIPGGIRQVSRGGGPVIDVAGSNAAMDLAVDETSLYWTKNRAAGTPDGQVMKLLRAGGQAAPLATNLPGPGGIALHGGYVHWTDGRDGTVMKVARDGGPMITLAENQKGPSFVAADTSGVYWTNGSDGTVMKLGAEGGVPIQLAAGQIIPRRIAIDACHVYWLDQEAGTVMKVPK